MMRTARLCSNGATEGADDPAPFWLRKRGCFPLTCGVRISTMRRHFYSAVCNLGYADSTAKHSISDNILDFLQTAKPLTPIPTPSGDGNSYFRAQPESLGPPGTLPSIVYVYPGCTYQTVAGHSPPLAASIARCHGIAANTVRCSSLRCGRWASYNAIARSSHLRAEAASLQR